MRQRLGLAGLRAVTGVLLFVGACTAEPAVETSSTTQPSTTTTAQVSTSSTTQPPTTTTTTEPPTTTTLFTIYEWHRVSDQGAHSVLTCTWGVADVECIFDETPAPGGAATVGEFEGKTVEASACLAHMAESCATAVSIAQGRQFYDNDGGVDFVIQATIAIQPDGTMIHSFDEGRPAAPFFCPFFTSKADAETMDDACTFA